VLAALVVGHVGAGLWTDAPTEARIDQKVELAVVVVDGSRVLAPAGIEKVRIGGHTRATSPLAGTVHWFAVEPHGFRVSPSKNGATSEFYSNVSTEPATFGRWLDYDHIDYFERALTVTSLIIPAAIDDDDQLAGLGTLRFKAEVTLPDGRVVDSPGAEATDTFGITAAVHRVSIRAADDFLGWLTAYLMVPEVFGSAGSGHNNQTERFDGADCADVMVGPSGAPAERSPTRMSPGCRPTRRASRHRPSSMITACRPLRSRACAAAI
jgi:hypothetical protein